MGNRKNRKKKLERLKRRYPATISDLNDPPILEDWQHRFHNPENDQLKQDRKTYPHPQFKDKVKANIPFKALKKRQMF